MTTRTLSTGRDRRPLLLATIIVGAALGVVTACTGRATEPAAVAEGWTAASTVGPEALARELASATANDRPVVVYTGPAFLYKVGHIPGAVAHGPASDPQKLADLKAWAQGLPRSTNLVVYCGCCPLDVCPNLQPSFAALRDMGFTHLRALILPTSFGSDWATKGLPVER
jgi:thiosulfate/3-mercaptopyruvate sulfurtransferase